MIEIPTVKWKEDRDFYRSTTRVRVANPKAKAGAGAHAVPNELFATGTKAEPPCAMQRRASKETVWPRLKRTLPLLPGRG